MSDQRQKGLPMPTPAAFWRGLPRIVRFFLAHAAVGFGLSTLFVGGLLLADPNGAGRLLLTGAGHWWPAVVLWYFVGLTFGAVQIGAATMLLEHRDTPRPRGGTGVPTGLVPIPVRVRHRRR
jgi:hypothetical protein